MNPPGHNLSRIQSRASKDARQVLEHVWDQFVATGEWPLRREVSSQFGGREKLKANLADLDFGYIFEDDPDHAPVMKMQLHGILCTRDSRKHGELLTAYLRLLRDANRQRPTPKGIDQAQAASALRLEAHEIPMLGRLLSIVSDRSVFRANYTTNPKTYETWSFSVPDSVDEIPDGDAADFLDSLLPNYADSRSIWRSTRQTAGAIAAGNFEEFAEFMGSVSQPADSGPFDRIYEVFVSSTFEDLKEERQHVMGVLVERRCLPTGMEHFSASSRPPSERIERDIRSCDYYLLILAGRYGSMVPGEAIGYTEREYDYARSIGKPVLAFFHADIMTLPAFKHENTDAGRELPNKFGKKVETSGLTLKKWTNPTDLGSAVKSAIHDEILSNPRAGWVRSEYKSTAPAAAMVQKTDPLMQMDREDRRYAEKLLESIWGGTDQRLEKTDIPAILRLPEDKAAVLRDRVCETGLMNRMDNAERPGNDWYHLTGDGKEYVIAKGIHGRISLAKKFDIAWNRRNAAYCPNCVLPLAFLDEASLTCKKCNEHFHPHQGGRRMRIEELLQATGGHLER